MTNWSGSRSLYFAIFFGFVLTTVVGTKAALGNILLITLPDRDALLNPDWPDDAPSHDDAFAAPALPVVTLAPEERPGVDTRTARNAPDG